MIELQRVAHPELYAASGARSSLGGCSDTPKKLPEYWSIAAILTPLGAATHEELSKANWDYLDDYWTINHPPYEALVNRFRADQLHADGKRAKKQKVHPLHTWRPTSGPALTPDEIALLQPIDRNVKRYNRVSLNGIIFQAVNKAKSKHKEKRVRPQLSQPKAKAKTKGKGKAKKRVVEMKQPLGTMELRRTVLATLYEKEYEADGTKLPVGTVIVTYGIIQEILLHRPWTFPGAPPPEIFCRMRWLVPVLGDDNRQVFDRFLPLVSMLPGHEWRQHPWTPLRLAYRTNIVLVQAADRPKGIMYAMDLMLQCPSPQYPVRDPARDEKEQ
jgi:hypothetical protein